VEIGQGRGGTEEWVSKHGTTEGAVVDALRDGSGFVEALTGNPSRKETEPKVENY
jgi:hypothetical protein